MKITEQKIKNLLNNRVILAETIEERELFFCLIEKHAPSLNIYKKTREHKKYKIFPYIILDGNVVVAATKDHIEKVAAKVRIVNDFLKELFNAETDDSRDISLQYGNKCTVIARMDKEQALNNIRVIVAAFNFDRDDY